MIARLAVNQLRGNSQPTSGLAHTSFKDMAYPQVASDLTNIDGLSLQGEGSVPCSY